MTVSSTANKIQYNGNAVTKTFSFPYPVSNISHIYATRTDTSVTPNVDYPLTQGTDFTVTLNATPLPAGSSGAVITMVSAPAATDRLTIVRTVPYTQQTSYPESGTFPAKSHENALDLLTEMVQQIVEITSRCITIAITSSGVSSLQVPSPQDGYYIGWSGTSLTNLPGAATSAAQAAASAAAALVSQAAALVSQNAAAASAVAAAASAVAAAASAALAMGSGNTVSGTIFMSSNFI